jgi:hypothetical protein
MSGKVSGHLYHQIKIIWAAVRSENEKTNSLRFQDRELVLIIEKRKIVMKIYSYYSISIGL